MSTSDNQPPKGSILEKYISQQPKPPKAEPEPTITESYTEMPTHVAMLDLVDEAGNHTALPYHALESVHFNPSGTITLKYHSQEVTLTGRNLKPIYDGITRQKASRIEVNPTGKLMDSPQTAVINILNSA